MKKRGWKECEDDNSWDIFWAEKEWIQIELQGHIIDAIKMSFGLNVLHEQRLIGAT